MQNKTLSFFRFREFNLMLVTISMLFVFMATGTYLGTQKYYANELYEAHEHAEGTSESLRQYITALLYKSQSKLHHTQLLASHPTAEAADPSQGAATFETKLSELISDSPEFDVLGVTDKDGNVTSFVINKDSGIDVEDLKTKNLSDKKFFSELKADPKSEFYVSEPSTWTNSSTQVLILAQRKHGGPEFSGVVFTSVQIQKIAEFFHKSNDIPDATIALYNSENVLLARYPHVQKALGKQIPLVEELKPILQKNELSSTFSGNCPIDKVLKVYGYSAVPDFGLRILWGKKEALITANATREIQIFVLVEILVFAITCMFCWFFYKSLRQTETYRSQELANAHLVALGEMAGGIAHEINNPLAVILGKTEQAQKVAAQLGNSTLQANLEKIRTTTNRISRIISGLKNLSRQETPEDPIPFNLFEATEEVLMTLENQIASQNIKVNLEIDKTLTCIGRPFQIEQVIMNLLSNSIYAIKDQVSPWISISASQQDDKVLISFTDSGNGIPKEIQDKILVPFFTTKPAGKGTGLGLSISKKVIADVGGSLELDSASPNTKFDIKLKLAA